MLFWFFLALMTGAAIFSVLWPLGFRRSAGLSASAADVAVYRDQLSEIERDRARNLIGASEAEAARVEIGRRLISASNETGDKLQTGTAARRRAAAIMALAGIPTAAVLLYLAVGSPQLSEEVPANSPSVRLADLLARIENHLAEKPDDGRGWELLAPVYLRLGRTADAVQARQNALRILGETADREADLGEALVADANGVVTATARTAFDRAVTLEPKHPKARFFLGLAAEQDGKIDEAESIWRALAADTPKDAPYLPAVLAGLERLKDSTGEAK